MKFFCLVALCCLSGAAAVTPVSKVLQMLGQLEATITKEGEGEAALYAKYMDWCKNGKVDTGYEIKTAKSQIEDLTATIGKSLADTDASKTKIEELSASISQDEADLGAASAIRTKEKSEFSAIEAELAEAVDMLDRAINILQKKMKGSSSLMQQQYPKDLKSMLSALNAVVDAASLSVHDKQKLMALAQSQNQDTSDDEEDEVGAPAPEAYKAKSGGIIDVLEDMREKAQGQLAAARKEESTAKHNFAMLKQSLDDQVSADSKELAGAKTTKASAEETKAVADGDMAVTKKDLADDEESLANLDNDCTSKADDHETSTASRAEELKALAAAKKVISEMTGGAAGRQYSFLQLDQTNNIAVSSRADLANVEVVNAVRELAKKEKSAALMQLAGRLAAVIRSSKAMGEDPFAKVKSMIADMVTKLEGEAKSEASHKEYCDKELGDSATKYSELTASIGKNSAKKDKAVSDSVKLKGEVQALQAELAVITKSQAEADTLRSEQSKAFVAAKADLEQGIEGIRSALKVLREYYASDEAALLQQPKTGAGQSIISMLEVIASDFGRSLAGEEVDEDASAVEYEKSSQMNRVTKSMKEKDVTYKTKEAASLDKTTVELNSDLESANSELDAVMEYKKGLIGACVAKPETYEQRVARRTAEVDGLKEALKIIEGQALLQTVGKNAGLRGAAVAPH